MKGNNNNNVFHMIYHSQYEKGVKKAGAELCQGQLRFEVWGLVKALSLIFENDNVEVKEVWI